MPGVVYSTAHAAHVRTAWVFVLRECGLWLRQARGVVRYSSADRTFAERLVGDLRRAGATAWIYADDDTAGNSIMRIDKMLAVRRRGGGSRGEIRLTVQSLAHRVSSAESLIYPHHHTPTAGGHRWRLD